MHLTSSSSAPKDFNFPQVIFHILKGLSKSEREQLNPKQQSCLLDQSHDQVCILIII